MLVFIFTWQVELPGARNEQKLQNEIFMSTVGFEHMPVGHISIDVNE